jgi:hypothetical protein
MWPVFPCCNLKVKAELFVKHWCRLNCGKPESFGVECLLFPLQKSFAINCLQYSRVRTCGRACSILSWQNSAQMLHASLEAAYICTFRHQPFAFWLDVEYFTRKAGANLIKAVNIYSIFVFTELTFSEKRINVTDGVCIFLTCLGLYPKPPQ